jgi:hypothetical protein
MRTALTFAALLSCYNHIISVTAQIQCLRRGVPYGDLGLTIVPDCYAALKMIPDGSIFFDGVVRIPLHFKLSPNAREPKLSFPAMYRSGHCAIHFLEEWRQQTADQDHAIHLTIHHPVKTASALYHQLFPFAKKLAKNIIETCLPDERTGFNGGMALVEVFAENDQEHIGTYSVMVRPPYPSNSNPFDPSINIYQADYSGHGHGSRQQID